MPRPLTPAEKLSIEQTLAFLKKLMDCYEAAGISGNADNVREMRAIADDLKGMLDAGKIDIERADIARKAKTNGSGIHINDDAGFSMPGDMHIDDCQEGYFASLWTLIEVLIHERYHYHHHTGFFGRVLKRIPDTLLGGAALMIGSLFGRTHRTWLWHEQEAYAHTYIKLIFLQGAVEVVCISNPDCIGCCPQHKQYVDEAKRRQNPWSN